MDPLSITVSAITLEDAGARIASTVKGFHADYRDAKKQVLHSQRRRDLLRTNQTQINQLPLQIKDTISPARLSINDIKAALSSTISSSRKRDRLTWALRGKDKVKEELSRLQDVESSTTLSLILGLF